MLILIDQGRSELYLIHWSLVPKHLVITHNDTFIVKHKCKNARMTITKWNMRTWNTMKQYEIKHTMWNGNTILQPHVAWIPYINKEVSCCENKIHIFGWVCTAFSLHLHQSSRLTNIKYNKQTNISELQFFNSSIGFWLCEHCFQLEIKTKCEKCIKLNTANKDCKINSHPSKEKERENINLV